MAPGRPIGYNRAFRLKGGIPQAEVFMKRTFQPSTTRRQKTHGFRVRMKTAAGRAVINARRAKGRKRVAV